MIKLCMWILYRPKKSNFIGKGSGGSGKLPGGGGTSLIPCKLRKSEMRALQVEEIM